MKKTNVSLSRSLIAPLALALSAQAPLVQAEIVDTDALSGPSQAEQDRAKVQSFLERANVKERLLAMGVRGVAAEERVAALNQQEIHALAQRIDTLPAGGALGTTEIILIVLIAILVAIAL